MFNRLEKGCRDVRHMERIRGGDGRRWDVPPCTSSVTSFARSRWPILALGFFCARQLMSDGSDKQADRIYSDPNQIIGDPTAGQPFSSFQDWKPAPRCPWITCSLAEPETKRDALRNWTQCIDEIV